RARVGDAAAHVDEKQRVVRRGDLGVQDRLLALVLRDEIAVLVDLERVGREAADGLLAVLHLEVDDDVARLVARRADGREPQSTAATSESQSERDRTSEPHGPRG